MARTNSNGTIPIDFTRPVLRIIGVCALALTTANCSNSPQKFAAAAPASPSSGGVDPKYGVKASPRLYNEGEAIPKGGGRRFSGKPYVVAGHTYVPREDARGYVREGLASWYGSAFHGRMTANGEVFDRNSIAAAHPTLPLPSYARVTNLKNGYSMVVRVNDRGPYHANRVMDVSEEVARALEFHRKGTEKVRVEYVGKASVAGSDDRKLLASLRTDGHPATTGAPIMMADLGPDQPSPDRFSRSSRSTLAFKPSPEAEQPGESAAEPSAEPVLRQQPRRPAPIVVASAASVPVPSVLQPTTPRAASFKPQIAAVAHSDAPSHSVVASRQTPLSLAPPPIRLASLEHVERPVPASNGSSVREAGRTTFKSKDVPASGAAPAALHKTANGKPTPDTNVARNEEPKKATGSKPTPIDATPAAPTLKVAGKVAAPSKPQLAMAVPAKAPSSMPNDAKLTMARLAAASASPAGKSAPVRRSHLAGVN